MAMPARRKQSDVGFADPYGSHRETWPPGKVQNPAQEVQVLPDQARGGAAAVRNQDCSE